MKSKELIEELKRLDPAGEAEVVIAKKKNFKRGFELLS